MRGLLMPRGATHAIVTEVCRYGAEHCETGGFLLACAATPDQVAIVALTGEEGIERRRGLLEVSAGALERLFTWAGERELKIAAQFHSHGRTAFLSDADIDHGFTVEGFTTSVVPWFADPPREPDAWGWWRCTGGEWVETDPPTTVDAANETVYFDEGGVYED
jgi:hypothetical protein